MVFFLNNFFMSVVNNKRIYQLNNIDYNSGPILYWMSREQRVDDNWGLLYAKEQADYYHQPIVVVFNICNSLINSSTRQFLFMLEGLKELPVKLSALNIPFYLIEGEPQNVIPAFINNYKIGAMVTDFDPLRFKRYQQYEVNRKINIPFYEVDSHNICPCRVVSNKQEYSARTIRSKIEKSLIEFLTDIPKMNTHKYLWKEETHETNWDAIKNLVNLNSYIPPIDWLAPGELAAKSMLDYFINNKLNQYNETRNIPHLDGVSNLSPYLHFGHISAQRVAKDVEIANANELSKAAFLEELIVRKELSDNFCFYNENYDNFESFPDWAKKSLNEHSKDERRYVYSKNDLEHANTHDDLWNASQLQMVKIGKMHGYMRMYWAKKILEWSKSPSEAIKTAIYLNDKYELDGNDPNGYTGIAWSIGGVHDRAWPSRPIFGKIRYMSYNGCKSKFDIMAYINKYKD